MALKAALHWIVRAKAAKRFAVFIVMAIPTAIWVQIRVFFSVSFGMRLVVEIHYGLFVLVVLFHRDDIRGRRIDARHEKQDYEHKKAIMDFDHKAHAETYVKEYPDLYPNGCGDCHHDENGKPLTNLGPDDPVQSCFECHKKPGEVPKSIKDEWKKTKPKKAEKTKVKLEYHAEAIHMNCKGCHKAFNKKYKPKKAPISCTKCHPKKK